MVCHQQSRATSLEHHSEWHSHKARYFRRVLLLIGTFIISSAATSGYVHSADKFSLRRRQLIKEADASNLFLRKGSNSQEDIEIKVSFRRYPQRTSKSKLHSVDPALGAPRGKAATEGAFFLS
jgi:hypothetical protein